jgi:hypothetical protein
MFHLKFSDHRKWGARSFLDYLEENNVQFTFDGQELSFDSSDSEEKARSIWHCLTGQSKIGIVA